MSAALKPAQASPARSFLSWLPLDEFFSVDLRSLAVLRIGLGIMLLQEWLNRLLDVRMHYSDDGLMPRGFVGLDGLSGPPSLFLLSGSEWFAGALMIVGCILAILLLIGWRTQFITLLCWFLLLSVHQRNYSIMQGGDLVMRLLLFWGMFLPLGACYSLDALREPLREWKPRVLSVGSVAYVLQMCMIYWFAAAWKTDPAWRDQHTAVYLALSLDGFATPFGHWLLNFPNFLQFLTVSTMALEIFGPALLFSPFANGWVRVFVIASFISFHVGLILTMELGNFPPICCVAWLGLLPACVWDRLETWFRSPKRAGMVLYYDGDNSRQRTIVEAARMFLLLYETKMVPAQAGGDRLAKIRAEGSWLVVDARGKEWSGYEGFLQLVRASFLFWPLAYVLQGAPRVVEQLARPFKWLANRRWIAAVLNWNPSRIAMSWPGRAVATWGAKPAIDYPGARIGGWAQNTIVGCLILYTIIWNIRTLDFSEHQTQYHQYFPDQMNGLANVLGLNQSWGLFAPRPGSLDGWYIVPAKLKNGKIVDLCTNGGRLTTDKPADVAATYGNTRTRKYLMNLLNPSNAPLRPYYAKYLFEDWNRRHGPEEQIEYLFILFMEKRTQPDRQVSEVTERHLQDWPIKEPELDPDTKKPLPPKVLDPITRKPLPLEALSAAFGEESPPLVNSILMRPLLPELMKEQDGP